jgi:glycosyltransferase involved in cell wall biosynthesis
MAGFPTKFVESITSGTIVLTNNNSHVQDFLTEGENGFLINISSLDAIIASLRVPLSMDKERLAIMKDKTFKSKLFDYRNYIKEFDKMF